MSYTDLLGYLLVYYMIFVVLLGSLGAILYYAIQATLKAFGFQSDFFEVHCDE